MLGHRGAIGANAPLQFPCRSLYSKEDDMKHLSNWIEIPVKDMDRARTFYQKVLQKPLQPVMEPGAVQYSLFPVHDWYNCGALAQGDGYVPSNQGVTVYLDGGDDVEDALSRVNTASTRSEAR